MREFSVPAVVDIQPQENLTDMVFRNATEYPDAVSFSIPADGNWNDVTTSEFAATVVAVAKGLIASGIKAGDRVGIMCRTRYEWALCDFAIWTAGAITVPIYPTSSAEQTEWILRDASPVALFVEDDNHQKIVESIQDRLPKRPRIWQLAAGALDDITQQGNAISDSDIQLRRKKCDRDTVATIIYTSGTTGRPKGCELTHGNLLTEIYSTRAILKPILENNASTLLFLPLAHVFARAIMCVVVHERIRTGFAPDTKKLLDDLATFQPTFLLAVPRVFEKVYNGAKQKADNEKKTGVFTAAEEIAIAYSQALENGRPKMWLTARHRVFDRLVYRRLRAALGGRCFAAISGGAPLGERLAHFFRGIGVTIYEGYGLTETTAGVFVNYPGKIKIGTVGPPVPDTAVRIDGDGEILLRGGLITNRYWNNKADTRAAIRDGWFHTGDLGELDEDGFLRITGRKKEIIVTASGKNVAPAILEDSIRSHPLISQCMVIGDQKPFVACLLTIDPESVEFWKQQHDKSPSATVAELREDAAFLADLQGAIDQANSAVSAAESIKKFRVLVNDFTEETGELTPSLKIKRNVVLDKYADEIDWIYQR